MPLNGANVLRTEHWCPVCRINVEGTQKESHKWSLRGHVREHGLTIIPACGACVAPACYMTFRWNDLTKHIRSMHPEVDLKAQPEKAVWLLTQERSDNSYGNLKPKNYVAYPLDSARFETVTGVSDWILTT